MNSDEDLAAYVLGARPENILYIGYFTFNFRLSLLQTEKEGDFYGWHQTKKQSKPQRLPMANFWCFF